MTVVASASATSFAPNYLPFVLVGTITFIAAIVFTVGYFVRERRRNQAAANPAALYEVEDAATLGIAEEDIYNIDAFDLISLGSIGNDNSDTDYDCDNEVTMSTINLEEGKEISCISSEEEGTSASASLRKISEGSFDYELTSITYGY